MDLFSYFKGQSFVKPVAADYMIMELAKLQANSDSDSDSDSNSDSNSYSDSEPFGTVYQPSKVIEHSLDDLKLITMRSDIDKLRQFLEGKYVFDEGETLAAIDAIADDREHVCIIAYSYIKSLSDFEHVFYKWSLEDASIWALDIVNHHIGMLNAAEIYAVVNMMMEEMCLLDN
jgi:hypothetical protein